MLSIPLPFSTNVWNVIKFVLLQLIVSWLLGATYAFAVAGRVGRLREREERVQLKESGFGIFTPYGLAWERGPKPVDKDHKIETTDLLLKTRVLIIVVNIVILGLQLVAEFGSGSTNKYERVFSTAAFGRDSARLVTSGNTSLRAYSDASVVEPGPKCVRSSQNTGSWINIYPFEANGTGCIEEQDRPEIYQIRACSPHETEFGVKKCSNEQFAALAGLNSSENWLGIGSDASTLALRLSAARDISPEDIKLVGTDNPGGSYKLVEGQLRPGTIGELSRIPLNASTGNGTTQCLVSTFDAGDYTTTVGSNKNWLVRACWIFSGKQLLVFGVDHDEDLLINTLALNAARFNRSFVGIESFRISKYNYLHVEGDSIQLPHVGLVMAVAGQCKLSSGLEKAPQSLRRNVINAFTRETLFRALGFVQGIGEYGLHVYDHRPKERATVDIRFIVPIAVLVGIGILQLFTGCMLKNDEKVTTSLKSALAECQFYQTKVWDEKWLEERLLECRTRTTKTPFFA